MRFFYEWFFFESLPIGIFKFFFLLRCFSFLRDFSDFRSTFYIPKSKKNWWYVIIIGRGIRWNLTFKCRRMFIVVARWKQGQRRNLMKHHHEVPAVQQFNENAFADRSRSDPLRFHNLSIHNCFGLISKWFGCAIDFYDYRYFAPNINSQLPDKKTFSITKGNATDSTTILIGIFPFFPSLPLQKMLLCRSSIIFNYNSDGIFSKMKNVSLSSAMQMVTNIIK